MTTLQTSISPPVKSFKEQLSHGYFQGYAYGYPHKTAYRPFNTARPLTAVWGQEDTSALFLYVHVPFCEMRCAFCNLFTTANPEQGLENAYLTALERQIDVVRELLPKANFARMAIGGGTPTFLALPQLERLFSALGALPIACEAPKAVELSPATANEEKLAFLRAKGVTRVSLGVQSFDETEARTLGRLQRNTDVLRALATMRRFGFPVVNVDLIYGMEGQTPASWTRSLAAALEFAPEELYLYPLYVRPLTGLARRRHNQSGPRLELYRTGRDFLLARGYRQVSLRLFRAAHLRSSTGPVYCCQEDGMVGLGAGARSYTRSLHYSTEWAVGVASVRQILARYVTLSREDFCNADYGVQLDDQEQRRRFLIKSILRSDGLDCTAYGAQFGLNPAMDFPWMEELFEMGALVERDDQWLPTERGLELSDVIGPWLYSEAVRQCMAEFRLT